MGQLELREASLETQVDGGCVNPEADARSQEEGWQSSGWFFQVLTWGRSHLVSREASPDTKQAPEKYSVTFTERSKGLSMASELPKVILSSRKDPDRGFVLRELPA